MRWSLMREDRRDGSNLQAVLMYLEVSPGGAMEPVSPAVNKGQ